MVIQRPRFHSENDADKTNPAKTNSALLASEEIPAQGLGRRRFVKVTGKVILGGLAVGLASGLAACSQQTTASEGANSATAVPTTSSTWAGSTTSATATAMPDMPGMTMLPGQTMPATSAAATTAPNPTTASATPTAAPTATAAAQNTGGLTGNLFVPPLLEPQIQNGVKIFNLTMQQGQSQFVAGLTTPTLGINGNFLGPTLRASQSDQVQINVTNQIGEDSTLHWHGLHVPAALDGGPHQIIANNATWSPRFTVQQTAATLWYHPHMMGLTRSQVLRGLVGMFILDDANPVQNSLPHTYGVDDFPLIIQDETFGANGQIIPNGGGGGRGGQTATLVNGSVSPTLTTSQTRLRLRILNASDQRIYTFGFANNATFYQVGSDGGLLPAPVALTRLQLAPAERAEIVVSLSDAQPLQLQSGGGNGGGGRGGRGGNGGGNLQGNTLLTIKPTATTPATNTASLPAQLATIERLQISQAVQTRNMVLGGNDNNPTINNQAMTSMAAMMDMTNALQIKLGTTEVWNIINQSGDTHAFHVHDIQFQILDRNGSAPAASEAGLKDTVMVSPRETVRIIMKFTDFADPNTPYMYHCHILEHEDNGMMGQFVVV